MDESSEGHQLPDSQKPSCSTWKNGSPIADSVDKHWESFQSIGSQEMDAAMFYERYAPTNKLDGSEEIHSLENGAPTIVASARLEQANLAFSKRRPTTASLDDNEKDSAAAAAASTFVEDRLKTQFLKRVERKCEFLKLVELTPRTSGVVSYMVNDKERTFSIKGNPPSRKKGTMRMDHAYSGQSESISQAECSSSDDPPSQPEENLWILPNPPTTYSKERQANSMQLVIQDVRTIRRTQFEQVTTTAERDCEIEDNEEARNHLVASATPDPEQEIVGLTSTSTATQSSSSFPDDLLEETPPSQVRVSRKVVVSSLNDKITSHIPVTNSEEHRSQSAAAAAAHEPLTNSSVGGAILLSSTDSLPFHQPLITTAAAAAKSSSVMMSCGESDTDIPPSSVDSMGGETATLTASSPEVLFQSKRRRVDDNDLVKSKANLPVSHIAGSKKDAVIGLTPMLLHCAPVLDNAKRDQLLSVEFPADTMRIVWQFLSK